MQTHKIKFQIPDAQYFRYLIGLTANFKLEGDDWFECLELDTSNPVVDPDVCPDLYLGVPTVLEELVGAVMGPFSTLLEVSESLSLQNIINRFILH